VRAGSLSSEGVIVGGSTQGGIGGGLTQSSTTNEIIKKNPEPKKQSFGCLLIIALFVTIISGALGPIGIGISLIVFGGLIWGVHKNNRDIFPRQLAEFEAKWICHRCGNIFVPEESLQAVS
jgi:hypothetical protein